MIFSVRFEISIMDGQTAIQGIAFTVSQFKFLVEPVPGDILFTGGAPIAEYQIANRIHYSYADFSRA